MDEGTQMREAWVMRGRARMKSGNAYGASGPGHRSLGSASIVLIVAIAIAILAIMLLLSVRRHWVGTGTSQAAGAGHDQRPYQYLDDEQRVMFRTVPGQGAAAGANHPGQQIRISKRAAQAAVQSGSLDVELPDGSRFPVVFEREETSPEGDWTLVGRVPSTLGAAVITFGRDGVFGVLPTPDGRMLQITSIRGESFIGPAGDMVPPGVSTPQADFVASRQGPDVARGGQRPPRPGSAAAIAHATKPRTAAASASPTTLTPAAGEVRIDVLGLYTTDLVALRGSVAAAKTEFTNLIAVANQAHIDSGSVVRLRLVAMQQTNYPAASFNDAALYALQANTLPDGLDVRPLRDRYAADLVAMLRPYQEGDFSCGIAFLSGAPEQASSDFGFSVSDTGSCGPLVLAHELGHNMGSMHDIETSTAPDGSITYGAFPFSFGYRQNGTPAFATVMAYSSGQPWVGYFSNPGSSICGAPCGIVDHADNVRSLNLMARTISRYRDPPNTISISDATATESDSESVVLHFTVKLSSPAPAAGVRFDLATGNGTAAAGRDYLSRSLVGQVIPEGQNSAAFDVTVLPDTLVEPDETMLVALKNVVGTTVFDPSGIGTIRNDDPRLSVSGKVLFPSGATPPASPFPLCGSSSHEWLCTTASPPDFQYSLKFPQGESVVLYAYPGDPFVNEEVALGVVNANTVRNINARLAAILTGRIITPVNEPTLTTPVQVTVWGYLGDPSQATYIVAQPPTYSFRQAVIPGSNVMLEVAGPPAPYVGQRVKLGVMTGNLTRNITLRQIPGILVDDAAFAEGAPGTHGTWGFGFRLSAPAPAGGVSFDVATANGSAVSGSDYGSFAASGLTIPEGQTFTQIGVDVFGDDLPEHDETFTVTVSNLHGAWLADAQGTGRILNDDIRKVASDFNGDGLSDILWRNGRSGANAIWRSASSTSLQAVDAVALSWRVAGVGDFDGDGRADILWRNGSSGANSLWKSGSKATVQAVAGITSQDWQVAGVGDFDADGRADILWRNAATGGNVIWKAGNKANQQAVVTLATDWRVAGIGDFDNDHRADILWRNHATGANVIWKAGNQATQLAVTARTDLAWQVAGVADFNNDHRADILWRHAGTGQNGIWRSGNAAVPQVVDPMPTAWKIAAAGDYNSDGYADILWRNTTTGENRIWRTGKSATGQVVATLADLAWSAAP